MAPASSEHRIKLFDIIAAREVFEAREPRDLFYRAATELVGRALRGPSDLTVAEALAILLLTWNKCYYRFHKAFDAAHFAEIEGVLQDHREQITAFRQMKIEELQCADGPRVHLVFEKFETILGPVGAAKALHLLAPDFFPLWDRKIAKAYGVPLDGPESKSDNYWFFFLFTKKQCHELIEQGFRRKPLKAIDEYNYCKHTKRWI